MSTPLASPVRFTLESNMVQGGEWLPEIAELLERARRCTAIELARTTGVIREAGQGSDGALVLRRLALLRALPAAPEPFGLGLPLFGSEATRGGTTEVALADSISRVLWGWPFEELVGRHGGNPSRIEEVINLATHVQRRRDVFVTADKTILRRSPRLAGLRIAVRAPTEALEIARRLCPSSSRSRRKLTGDH